MSVLVRLAPGRYRTPDGAFDVTEDPCPEAHGFYGRHPRHVWLIYAKGEEPQYHRGVRGWGTLREARQVLPAVRAAYEEEMARYAARHHLVDLLAGSLLARGGTLLGPSNIIVWFGPAEGCR